jgi:hypothetical protein
MCGSLGCINEFSDVTVRPKRWARRHTVVRCHVLIPSTRVMVQSCGVVYIPFRCLMKEILAGALQSIPLFVIVS